MSRSSNTWFAGLGQCIFLPESRVLSQTLLRVKAILRSSYREPRNDLVPRIFPSQKKMCVSDCGPTAQALNIHPSTYMGLIE
ncbi:uncharacterized protein ARMOST_19441 [Armillaria ostoyae]|uniref:Uncharacterized protein n=1 Tax=Armillaria ostoyae TaxID=47428 RepID=A0A284S4J7_ARMOS|nr:uncharacterized protein ARMOST_19441 [Armillaria ostoyae]